MKGKVLEYDDQIDSGLIEDQRGAQFKFEASQWSGSPPIETGTVVNFRPKGSKKGPVAAQIVPVETTASTA